MISTHEPAAGHLIVGTPRERSREPGFFTRQIVTHLSAADGELWHGRQADSLIILRIDQMRMTGDGVAPSSADLPLAVDRDDWVILAFSRPLDRIGRSHWTRICGKWEASRQNDARQRLGQLEAPVVLARVIQLHHTSETGNQRWLWQANGALAAE